MKKKCGRCKGRGRIRFGGHIVKCGTCAPRRRENPKKRIGSGEPYFPHFAGRHKFYVIQQSDVGVNTIRAFGRIWFVSDFLGRIMRRDVGKRVYLIEDGGHGFLQAENREQFEKRISRNPGNGNPQTFPQTLEQAREKAKKMSKSQDVYIVKHSDPNLGYLVWSAYRVEREKIPAHWLRSFYSNGRLIPWDEVY